MSQELNIYRCPKCRGLLGSSILSKLSCENCQINFPVYKNVPILIDEESSVFRIKDIIEQGQRIASSLNVPRSGILKFCRYMIESFIQITPTLYSKKRAIQVANIFLKEINNLSRDKITVLSIGNGVGGLIFTELKNNPRFILIETDVYISPNRMFVSDVQQIPLESLSVDVILVEGVLEHVIDSYKAVSEMHRVLRDNGLMLSTTPFIMGVHMEVADYSRFTRLGLLKLFQKFQPIECGVIEGAFVALAYQISYVLMTLTSVITSGNSNAIRLAKYMGNFFIFWLKYLDFFARDNPISQDAAVNLFYIGKKATEELSDIDINAQFSGYGICPK